MLIILYSINQTLHSNVNSSALATTINNFDDFTKAALNLEVPPTDTPPSIPEGLKNKFSEETASTSLKKTGFYGGTAVVIYFSLIIVGMIVGVC